MNRLLRRVLATWPSSARAGTPPLPKMLVAPRPPRWLRSRLTRLDAPRWLPADRDQHMRPTDPVLGLLCGNAAFAIPWWIMKNHHVLNLVLEGRPIVVVLCEACASGSAFTPVVAGKRYRFVVEGVYNTTPILSDLESGSLWALPTGEALHGPLAGTRLERQPLYQSTWQEWKALYPHSWVPDGRGEPRDGHGAEFPSPMAPVVAGFVESTRLRHDDRLPQTELVLGVEVGRRSKAYPLEALHRLGSTLEDTIDGEEIVVFTRPGSWVATAYRRTLDGRRLHFSRTGDFPVEDAESGSRWDISGRAVKGPLAGKALQFLPSGIEKWYAWVAYHPGTEIHGMTP